MRDATPSLPPSGAVPALIEVDIAPPPPPGWRTNMRAAWFAGRIFGVGFLLLFGSVSTALSLADRYRLPLHLVAPLYVLPLLAVFVVCAVIEFKKRAALRQAFELRSPESIVAAYFKDINQLRFRWKPPVILLARLLDQHGWRGHSVRVGHTAAKSPIAPITAPFEARALDDTRREFDELRDMTGDLRARPSLLRRRGGVWLQSALVLAAVPIGIIVLLMAQMAGIKAAIGAGFAGFAAAAVIDYVWRSQRMRSRSGRSRKPPRNAQWLIAPGALVLRWPHGQRYSVRVIGRSSHVLLASVFGEKWEVVIAGEDGVYLRLTSQLECEMLLRAWLSPLPPPDEARFSDWTSDA